MTIFFDVHGKPYYGGMIHNVVPLVCVNSNVMMVLTHFSGLEYHLTGLVNSRMKEVLNAKCWKSLIANTSLHRPSAFCFSGDLGLC